MAALQSLHLGIFIIFAAIYGILGAEKTKVHNFMAQPFGQVITEQVEMVL